MSELLNVERLGVSFPTAEGPVTALRGVSFSVAPGETVAIVGESGSGKSVTALTVFGLLGTGRIDEGSVRFRGQELVGMPAAEHRRLRGRGMAMIFQDPMASLDPLFTIGFQIEEALRLGGVTGRAELRARSLELLRDVGIPDPERKLSAYPHQLSGGQRQRVMIAIAMSCSPELIVADEPTTALDVTVEAQILELMRRLQRASGTALLIITHDMSVVARMADRVVVMYRGVVVEEGPVQQVLADPVHPYTRGLIRAVPTLTMDKALPLPTIESAEVVEPAAAGAEAPAPEDVRVRVVTPRAVPEAAPVRGGEILVGRDLVKRYRMPRRSPFEAPTVVNAVDGVSFSLRRGETLGVVGESGSGKSTTARLAMRMVPPTSGEVEFDGIDVLAADRRQMHHVRRRMQMIFQDPRGSLDPRMRVLDVIAEPLDIHRVCSGRERTARVHDLLERVGLTDRDADKFAHQFSGGQAQRIAIARALATEPEVVVCDEAVSALDVSVQAQILNLLKKLQRELGLAYLFISHDLSVVRYMSDDVMVMKSGSVVEHARCDDLFDAPTHPYTRELLGIVSTGQEVEA